MLTSEIPTMSINITGRRQVFVESGLDVRRFEVIYQRFKSKLNSERSLNFIAAGGSEKYQNSGDGCSRVYSCVSNLCGAGNHDVFGLVDWDGRNVDVDQTYVLAKDERYSIENCILDPKAVLYHLVSIDAAVGAKIGLPNMVGYVGLRDLDFAKIQAAIDGVERAVLGPEGITTKTTVVYVDGSTCEVSKEWLAMRGHDLEGKIKAAFPALRRYGSSGSYIMDVITRVYVDYGESLLPVSVLKSFQRMLD